MLEIGVGSGRVAVPTALAGITVVGVDASETMLELARRRAAPHDLRLTLVRADMRDLPELGTFPLVTVPFRAFLHLRDDSERLAVLRRCATGSIPAGRSPSTSSIPTGSISPRHTGAGSSASRASTSGRSGTRTPAAST